MRLATIALIFALLTTNAVAGEHVYGWTISSSAADPFANTGSATFGVTTLYLWYQCSTIDGMASAEFDIEASGIVHLATIPQNGFLNAGGTSNLLLAVGLCPIGPMVAANLLVTDLPGEICIVPSLTNGFNVSVDCDPAPSTHENRVIGYNSEDVSPSCGDANGCRTITVDAVSWSRLKGMYR